MSDKPAILVIPRHLGPLAPMLEDAYTVYRFWEGPPAHVAATIRAAVTVGSTPHDAALMDSLTNLGLLAYFSVGYESFDAQWAAGRGIAASHAQGVNHEDTADLALGLIISQVRGIAAGDQQIRAGGWLPGVKSIWPSLGGKRAGIVGLGAIGEAVARRCEAVRMAVSWWGPRDKPGAAWPRAASLIDLARDSDVLVVCAQSAEDNRGLISAEVIEALGPRGVLINIARGMLVDEPALIAALREGRLGGAGLDVFEEEPNDHAVWADVPNVVMTPHIAGATDASVQAMALQLRANLDAWFAGRPLLTPIRG